eukprot:9467177-Pyramimonas_sp.AAC.1
MGLNSATRCQRCQQGTACVRSPNRWGRRNGRELFVVPYHYDAANLPLTLQQTYQLEVEHLIALVSYQFIHLDAPAAHAAQRSGNETRRRTDC